MLHCSGSTAIYAAMLLSMVAKFQFLNSLVIQYLKVASIKYRNNYDCRLQIRIEADHRREIRYPHQRGCQVKQTILRFQKHSIGLFAAKLW